WKKNQTLPKTQLLEKIHKNFATQFENKKRAEFLWWKKYLETLEGLHSKEYLEVLLTPLQKGSNELQIYFCLQKIKSFVPNGKKDSDKIAKVLVQILHQIHWKKDIRALAIEGLGKFYSTCSPQWKGKTLLALKKILRRSSHISLRIKACNTLAALQETSVLTLFLSILRDPKAALPVVQEVIRNVSAFSETKDNQIVEAILYRLKLTYGEKISSSSMVNHSELLALSIEKLGGFPYYRSQTLELALQVLSHFLKHPSMKIRYFAATSLGRIGNVQSLLPLMEAFHSSDQAVQKAILKSMESIYVQNQKQIPQPLKKKILLFLWEYSKNLKLQSNLPSFFRKILTIEDISFFLFFLVQLKKNQTSNFLSLQYAQMILDVFRSISQKKGFTDGLANLDSSQKDLLFLMLGNANLVLKKYQKAIEAFKKVQKMNEWEELEFLLAKAKAGQHKEVLEDLKKRKFSLPPKQVQSIIQEIIQELGQDKSIKVNQLLEKWALEKTFDPTFLKSLGWSSHPSQHKKKKKNNSKN
ncbi:MAG: HEAT repeat domain-containing protein, partial [Planctomycetota bacterium]